MKYMSKIFAAVIVFVMLLSMFAGCNGTPDKNGDGSVPGMTVGKEEKPAQDAEGSFQIGDFVGEKSNAGALGGSRTEKIQELEEAEIQRETVPDGSVDWIPGIW